MGWKDTLKELTGWDKVEAERAAAAGQVAVAEYLDFSDVDPDELQDAVEQEATIEAAHFYGTAVAGTSNYQQLLKRASDNGPDGPRREFELAVLEFEPTNKYDKKAIRVVILGETAGYISREDQAEVAPLVRQSIKEFGEATCAARFVGGGDVLIGVRLGI